MSSSMITCLVTRGNAINTMEKLKVSPLSLAVPIEGPDEGTRAFRETAVCKIELCTTEAELELQV